MRVCFSMKVRQDKLAEYKRRHAAVWPEMQEALRLSGWQNYSIFLRPDGLVVGYLEADDFETARTNMKNHPVNARWQSEMAPLVESLNGNAVDDSFFPLEEIFHLD